VLVGQGALSRPDAAAVSAAARSGLNLFIYIGVYLYIGHVPISTRPRSQSCWSDRARSRARTPPQSRPPPGQGYTYISMYRYISGDPIYLYVYI